MNDQILRDLIGKLRKNTPISALQNQYGVKLSSLFERVRSTAQLKWTAVMKVEYVILKSEFPENLIIRRLLQGDVVTGDELSATTKKTIESKKLGDLKILAGRVIATNLKINRLEKLLRTRVIFTNHVKYSNELKQLVNRGFVSKNSYMTVGSYHFTSADPVYTVKITQTKSLIFMKKIREVIRELNGRGFKQLFCNILVSEYWNFEYLGIPKEHPARNIRDTFYTGRLITENTPNGLKTSREMLRPQLTGVFFAKLWQLGVKQGAYYTFGPVFRRESEDATHLAQFIQLDVYSFGEKIFLPHIRGAMRLIGQILGVKNITLSPTGYPYTRPSIEMSGQIAGVLGECGGGGLFPRPLLEKIGIPGEYGIGISYGYDRMIMIENNLKSIKDVRHHRTYST